MRERGAVYWAWADQYLHVRNHDEHLADGRSINVQVRHSMRGETQLFVGIYDLSGEVITELSYDSRTGETMTRAMDWGLQWAKDHVVPQPAKASTTDRLPRQGSAMAIRRDTIRRIK